MTPAQELALINAAITAILEGKAQSYSMNGRDVTRLDLNDLWKRKNELEAAIARDSSIFSVARMRDVQ